MKAPKRDDETDPKLTADEEAVSSSIVELARLCVEDLFSTSDEEQYPFHTIEFIHGLVESATELVSSLLLEDEQKEHVLLATWFAYSGYARGQPAIPEKSISFLRAFLREHSYPETVVRELASAIRMVHEGQNPEGLVQQAIHDACWSFLVRKKFIKRCRNLRKELENVGTESFSDLEWARYVQGILNATKFHTTYAKAQWGERLAQQAREVGEVVDSEQEISHKMIPSRELERGVDTLFRTQSRHLTSLVSIADRKAQMIIGVNSLSLSILIANIDDYVSQHPIIMIPAGIFVCVTFATMIFSILVIRPTSPKSEIVTQDDVLRKHGVLMQQLVFSDIRYEDFKLGVRQMMLDEEYLYENLIHGLYGNGRVLRQKFRYLKIAYTIFSIGMLASAVSFIVIAAIQFKL